MAIDANDLKKEQLFQWIGRYCHDRRWILAFSLPPEEKAIVEQECDEHDRRLIALVESEVIERGRDMGIVLAELVNGISDAWREGEFIELRAPVPGPVDTDLFSKSGDEITDADFFKIIWKNPAYMGAVFTLDKITNWRREMYSGDQSKSDNAKAMLIKIGATLAREKEKEGRGTGHREGVPTWMVIRLHDLIWRELVESKMRFQDKDNFPDLKKYVLDTFNIMLNDSDENEIDEDPTDTLRPKNLAAYLTGKRLGLKTTGVLSILQNK